MMGIATTEQNRYRCEFEGSCDTHGERKHKEPDRYAHRPLPCRLGIHGHYSEETGPLGWYRRICLVCGHGWMRALSSKGVEVHPPPPGPPPTDASSE